MLDCPLEYYCECGDLAVRLLPLSAIGSKILAQLILFMNKLLQLGILPGNLSFADRLDGDGL